MDKTPNLLLFDPDEGPHVQFLGNPAAGSNNQFSCTCVRSETFCHYSTDEEQAHHLCVL